MIPRVSYPPAALSVQTDIDIFRGLFSRRACPNTVELVVILRETQWHRRDAGATVLLPILPLIQRYWGKPGG